jgi:hypothetical protein
VTLALGVGLVLAVQRKQEFEKKPIGPPAEAVHLEDPLGTSGKSESLLSELSGFTKIPVSRVTQ